MKASTATFLLFALIEFQPSLTGAPTWKLEPVLSSAEQIMVGSNGMGRRFTTLDAAQAACFAASTCVGVWQRTSLEYYWVPSGNWLPWAPGVPNGSVLKVWKKVEGAPALEGHGHGDPHLKNFKGEDFDVNQEGTMLLLETPRQAKSDSLNLAVHAEIVRLGAALCGPTYITQLDMHGAWLEHRLRVQSGKVVDHPGVDDKHAFGIRFDDARWLSHASFHDETQGSFALSTVAFVLTEPGTRTFVLKVKGLHIVVSQPKRPRVFLDVQINGLETLDGEIGGLLGVDDHSEVERLPEECQ